MKTLALLIATTIAFAGCAGPAGTAPAFPTPEQITADGKAIVAVSSDVGQVKENLKGAK